MGTSPEGPGPEIGLTGARFGGASRRRRPRSAAAPAAPGTAAETDADDGGAAATPIGLTGARFGGSRRSARGPAAALPSTDALPSTHALPSTDAVPPAAAWPLADASPPVDPGPPELSPYATVRPYVLTRGRTRSRIELPIEALVSSVAAPGPPEEGGEQARIRELCRSPRSVAEVAALLGMPLGVARVLLGDLAAAGFVAVHRTADAAGPDLLLMERVLAGLRRL